MGNKEKIDAQRQEYETAMNDYKAATEAYKTSIDNLNAERETYKNNLLDYKAQTDEYKNKIDTRTGEEGYKKSLDLARQGSRDISRGIQGQVSAATRNAGLTSAQAADLGAAAASKGYYDSLVGQQTIAGQQLGANLQGYGSNVQHSAQGAGLQAQGAGLATQESGLYSQAANQKLQAAQSHQQQQGIEMQNDQNQWDKVIGTTEAVLGSSGSAAQGVADLMSAKAGK